MRPFLIKRVLQKAVTFLSLMLVFSSFPVQAAVTNVKPASPKPIAVKSMLIFTANSPAPNPTATANPSLGSVSSGPLSPAPQTANSPAPASSSSSAYNNAPKAASTPKPSKVLNPAPAKLDFQSYAIKLKVGPILQRWMRTVKSTLDHVYTVNLSNPPSDYHNEIEPGYLFNADSPENQRAIALGALNPVYKLYNPATTRSLLTTSKQEVDRLTSKSVGYQNLGVLGYVANAAFVTPEMIRGDMVQPLYRVAGPSGDTVYTSNIYEVQNKWEKPPYNYSIVGGPIGYVGRTLRFETRIPGPKISGQKYAESADGKYAYYRGTDRANTVHYARYDKSNPGNVFVYPPGVPPAV